MRHAVFISFYPNLIPRNWSMVRSLKENGWRVSVILWNRYEGYEESNSYCDLVDEWRRIELPAGKGKASLFTLMPQLYRLARQELETLGKVDLVSVSHVMLLPVLASCRETLRIYDAAEYFVYDLSKYFRGLSALFRPLLSFMESRFLASVNGITLVDSRDDWLENHYRSVSSLPVQVLWNVPSRDDDPEDQNHEEHRSDDPAPLVAYVGAFKASKGFDVMLNTIPLVVKDVPDVRFAFYGQSQRSRTAIEAELRSRDIENNVQILDALSYQDLLMELRSARLAIALLQGERNQLIGKGNSRKVFTYMQAGLPIVVSRSCKAANIVEENNCGITVESDAIESIAEGIVSLLKDRQLACELGRNGRRAFEEQYNWEIESRKYQRFIDQLHFA